MIPCLGRTRFGVRISVNTQAAPAARELDSGNERLASFASVFTPAMISMARSSRLYIFGYSGFSVKKC